MPNPSALAPRIDRIVLSLPAYNEAEVIGELLKQAADALKGVGLPYHIVVVDDGSTDATAEIVREARKTNPSILLLQHETNRGLGPAILTGLGKAVELAPGPGALVVCMDADLTHPPEVIPAMRAKADAGADLVIASRYEEGSQVRGLSAFRALLSWGARTLFRVTLPIPGVRDYTCGFRGIRASLLEQGFEQFGRVGLMTRRGFACTDELLLKLVMLGPKVAEVPFVLRYDLKRGKSKIRLGVTIWETLRLIAWARGEMKRRSPLVAPPPQN